MKNHPRETISAETELFAVLGHPIGHSLSPAMHNAAFEALEMNALYLAFDVAPERLMVTLGVMADLGFRGVNLTVPLKEEAFRGISKLSDSARILGSVNTVSMAAGGLEGHSTDGEGFARGVREAFDISLSGISIFVLGCGGAGRAVALAAAMKGADMIRLADLEMSRARRLESEITGVPGGKACVVQPAGDAWTRASLDSDLVVQSTPVGMHEDEEPLLDSKAFRPGQYVYDLIYMFPETRLMKAAREAGAGASNGLGMLLFQGALAFSVWTGRDAPVDLMRRVLEEAVYGTQ